MNYHCAKFYNNISTNMDTINIFPFLAILYQYIDKYGHYKYFPISRDFFTAIFGPIQLGIIANIVS